MTATELWLVDLDSSAEALERIEAETPRLSDYIRRRIVILGD
jgi:hypothetical protein